MRSGQDLVAPNEIRTCLVAQLNHALRGPGMLGGETAIRMLHSVPAVQTEIAHRQGRLRADRVLFSISGTASRRRTTRAAASRGPLR